MTAPLPIIAAFLIAMLCGCERGPTEKDMAHGCASHRTPTWADLIGCNPPGRDRAARDEETVK